jgi:hypothetical protein
MAIEILTSNGGGANLLQDDVKHVVPTPLSGIRVGER